MTTEQTLSIIKPDAVKRNIIGKIYTRFEEAGLKIVEAKMLKLNKVEAEAFYQVHRMRPFYESLTTYMSSGPIMVQILEGKDAIAKNREVMGATNPKEAKCGTIRAEFALSIEENSVHGSDSQTTAKEEINFFFPQKTNN